MIIYGENFITPGGSSSISTPGSHIDIIPTIISLIAPDRFEYQSFGDPLLERTGSGLVASEKRIGFGYNRMILNEHIVDVGKRVIKGIGLSDGKEPHSIMIQDIIGQQRSLFGLSWWRIFRGNDLQGP